MSGLSPSPLWTLGELAAACGGRLRNAAPDTVVSGVSIDTRTLGKGEAFFAIKGVSMDGHQFVPDALEKGAAAVVVSAPSSGPCIQVDDTMDAMRRAAAAARARLADGTAVVAVTGSVGKTGTKEMLKLAFAASGSAHASSASHNNHWGVPLSLTRMPRDVRAGIFEIGMNHAGEITPLTRLVRPTVAIITTVAAVHLEFFDSVAGIADAKAEIFLGLAPGGIAIIPADNEYAPRLTRAAQAVGAKIVTFGTSTADVSPIAWYEDGFVEASVFGAPVRFPMGDVGPHNRRNALAVLAALYASGRNVAQGANRLAQWQTPKGRGKRITLTVPGGEATLLDDAYNANPASMAAAIAVLEMTPAERRVAILGDMRELGPTAPDLHGGLAPLLVKSGVRIVHTVGAMSEHLRNALPENMRGEAFATADDVVRRLPEVRAGDAILVKASLGTGLPAVVAALQERYGKAGDDNV